MTLTHEGILAMVFVGAILAMILFSVCISGLLNYIDKRRRKQHPMLFTLQEQAKEASERFLGLAHKRNQDQKEQN